MYSIQPSTDETTQTQQQNTEHTEINGEEKLHQPLFRLKKKRVSCKQFTSEADEVETTNSL